jgi:ComF family protein
MDKLTYTLFGKPILPLEKPYCETCSEKLSNEGYQQCYRCYTDQYTRYFTYLRAVGHYTKKDKSDRLSQFIRLKYLKALSIDLKEKLAKGFAELLNQFISNNQYIIEEIDYIFPVPMFEEEEIEKGFNLVKTIVKFLSEKTGIEGIYDNLVKIRKTKKQAHLNQEERIENVKRAYIIQRPDEINEKQILLIDDVTTSCATVNECARVLIEAGVKEVRVLVLARKTNPPGGTQNE